MPSARRPVGRPTRSPLPATARAPAARRADASADARRVRRPGAPRRRARSAPPEHRPRPPLLAPAVGSARDRQDEPRAAARGRGRRPFHDACRRSCRASSRSGRHRRGAGTADPARHPDDPVPRRDPPLQQGPAGRAAAARRGRHGHAHRRDDREPVLRGELGAAVADARLAARGPDRRRRRLPSSAARSTTRNAGSPVRSARPAASP